MAAVLADLVGDDDDALRSFGLHLARDLGHADRAIDRLASGHRDGVVVEQLVGDVGVCGDGLPNRQQARVKVGAVAEVLEDMALGREARVRGPIHTLGAHLDQAAGAALHPARHEVAADAGQRARTFGHLGAAVVRATGAEVGLALDSIGVVGQQRRHREIDDEVAPVERRVQPRQPLGNDSHDARRPQFAQRRQQWLALRIRLAGDARPLLVGHGVQQLLDLPLDDRRFFFDDEDLLQPVRKVEHARRLEREDEADLVNTHARRGERVRIEFEAAQHFHEIEMCLADGDDAQRRARAGDDMLVERVDPGERAHSVELQRQPLFQCERRQIDRAHMQGLRGYEVHRQREVQRHRVEVHRHAGLDHFADRLEAHPRARKARQRPAVQPELQVLGDVARVQHRHAPGLHRQVALVRHRRRDAAVVVTGNHEHTALRRRAVDVAVLERIARAIDAGAFAVPHRGHAIDRALRVQRHALRAQARRGRQVFVDGRQELHAGGVEQLLRLPQLLIDHAQRRAAIAGNEGGRLQAGGFVGAALHQQQAHQRLRAGEKDGAGGGGEVVLQTVVAQFCHGIPCGLGRDGRPELHGRAPVESELTLTSIVTVRSH